MAFDNEASAGPAGEITALLRAAGEGDGAAREQVFAAVYDELRALARRQRRRRGAVTLDTTALVHEAYLKLGPDASWSVQDRAHFFALAARAMRQIVVDGARHHGRLKRGAGAPVVALSEDAAAVEPLVAPEEVLALDEALDRLAASEPDLARIVEWRFFGGWSVEEIAGALAVSDRTVKRHWRTARAYLYRELQAAGASS